MSHDLAALEANGYLIFDEDQADELLDLIVRVRKHLDVNDFYHPLKNDLDLFISENLLHAMPVTRDDA